MGQTQEKQKSDHHLYKVKYAKNAIMWVLYIFPPKSLMKTVLSPTQLHMIRTRHSME